MRSVEELEAVARAVMQHAHTPYSHFRVGSALETADGEVFAGCNIENASYGVTVCAERVALGAAVAAGKRDFRRIVVVTDRPEPVTPCGVCRQALVEFAPALEVIAVGTSGEQSRWRADELLPAYFRFPERTDDAEKESEGR